MSDNQINYEELAQEALRGVIRSVMTQVEKLGELPGDHHFFIAFDTRAKGVDISHRLLEQYPEEMTIVLQHQFWDLKVLEDYFEVKLSFNNVLERLVIPYRSIKVFFDPSVTYGLQFGPTEAEHESRQTESSMAEILEDKTDSSGLSVMTEFSMDSKKSDVESSAEDEKKEETEEEKSDSEEPKSADIVSLDTFRKK